MRRLAFAAAALTLVTLASPAAAQLKLPRISPDASVKQTIGVTDLAVTYSRPGVKGRVIWGGLEAYDKPWRTGANNATTFTTSHDITFGGQPLGAGTYGLATIPGKDTWVVILNSQSDVWGTQYDESKDVLRVTVKPEVAPHQEWLFIGFDDMFPASGSTISDQANLVIRWDKLRLAVPIKVDVTGNALANCREAVTAAKPDDWRTAFNAARYSFSNDVGLDEGKGWLEKSLAVQKNYTNLTLLARWQMKDGMKKEAIATAKQAIAAGKASKDKVDTSETEKLVDEWSGKGASKKS
ncbi:MAG: hypothetical protein A2W00_04775 [Candidatus Eisenbacteria bacterium RBG_16_71_46]|nr:MAG: hypothetical protein A2W00_04775 [Candidatus Eisenbacteria bacterium RBG_16_71_46]